ncbi:hypothetical protein AB0H36_06000 [Kribbella sp. NPDC050820]
MLTVQGFYDVALRDFGLLVAALALPTRDEVLPSAARLVIVRPARG